MPHSTSKTIRLAPLRLPPAASNVHDIARQRRAARPQ